MKQSVILLTALWLILLTCHSLAAKIYWSPADLTNAVEVWLDADDASTITESAGRISKWTDKSGHAREFTQGIANAQPHYEPGGWTNGRDQIRCDTWNAATRAHMLGWSATGQGITGTAYTLFLVVDARTIDNEGWPSTHRDTNGKENRYQLQLSGVRVRSDASNGGSATAAYVAGAQILQFTLAASSSEIRRDGTQVAGDSGPYTPAPLTGDFTFNARGNGDGHAGMDGDFGEFLFLSENPDTDTREKIEGYLAWKWGLEDKLPTDHTYKDGPPGKPPSGTVLTIK